MEALPEMAALTSLELIGIQADQKLYVKGLCSPALLKLRLIWSRVAIPFFLAPSRLRQLKHFYCTKFGEADDAEVEDSWCSYLLGLPNLEVMSGSCKLFRESMLTESQAWQEGRIEQGDAMLRRMRSLPSTWQMRLWERQRSEGLPEHGMIVAQSFE